MNGSVETFNPNYKIMALIQYSFYGKSANTRQAAIELVRTTDKTLKHRHGFAFRGAPLREVTREKALKICEDSFLDVDELENEVILNTYSELDME